MPFSFSGSVAVCPDTNCQNNQLGLLVQLCTCGLCANPRAHYQKHEDCKPVERPQSGTLHIVVNPETESGSDDSPAEESSSSDEDSGAR